MKRLLRRFFRPSYPDTGPVIPEAALRDGLNQAMAEALPPVALGLGVICAVFMLSHLIFLAPPIRWMMASVAGITAAAMIATYAYLRRHPLPPRWAHPWALILSLAILLNPAWHMYLTQDPAQTTYFILLILGTGSIFLSANWFTALVVMVLTVWSFVYATLPTAAGWLGDAYPLFSATALAAIIQAARLRTARRLERFRIRDARYKVELEAVLKATDEAQRSLATSIAVGQSITSILDVDVLLPRVAELIRMRFGLSFVGIFLLDESREYVVCHAGTGSVGRKLVERGYQLKVGEEGIAGWAAAAQKPVRVDDVLQEPRYRQADASLLTRSALALPLEMGRELLGVLLLESEKVAAFKEDDVPFLQLLADQVAVALNNASLYSQVTRFNQDLEKLVQQRTQDLQRTYEQLERLDRAKSNFISISSHELRTPVTLLKGYSQMLLEDRGIQQNPAYFSMVSGIQAGANRLHDIIESMLDVAKIDNKELQLHLTPLFIPVLVSFVCEGLKEAIAERQITLVQEFPELPQIQGDLEGLRKVFYQLIVNAIKYTPDGGKITLTGRPLQAGELGMPQGGVEVVVSDTGIGIDPEMRELIFVKFYQTGEVSLHSSGKTKFKGGGPGLGLAIAKGIVAAHGGLIWAESPGYDEKCCPGSQFHVVLPLEPLRST